jgi:hypothetical protein
METAMTIARMSSGFTGTLTDPHSLTRGTFPEGALTGSGTMVQSSARDLVCGTLPTGALTGSCVTVCLGSAYNLFCGTLPAGTLTGSGFTGTMTFPRELFEAAERDLQRIYWASPNIIAEFTDSQQIFDSIQALYLSSNTSRDRQIADRITALHRDALADDEHILPASLNQFADFFLGHPELGFPKITLTPDSTLRARWIRGPNEFVAIEFTGEPRAKLVAEIPRDEGLMASYFATEPVSDIVSTIRALGASLAK